LPVQRSGIDEIFSPSSIQTSSSDDDDDDNDASTLRFSILVAFVVKLIAALKNIEEEIKSRPISFSRLLVSFPGAYLVLPLLLSLLARYHLAVVVSSRAKSPILCHLTEN